MSEDSEDIVVESVNVIRISAGSSESSEEERVSTVADDETATKANIRDISVPTQVEHPDTVTENKYKYKARGDRFIPVPRDNKYYDISEDTTKELSSNMVISRRLDLIKTLYRLRDYPFLLVDSENNTRFDVYDIEDTDEQDSVTAEADPIERLTAEELKQEYPEKASEHLTPDEERYSMVTLTEVNKRATKVALYPYIASFEGELSEIIEKEYPNSEHLVEVVGDQAQDAWEKNKGTETEVHIAEFLNLTDIRELISDSTLLSEKCGFESTEDAYSKIDNVKTIRNKVMHANRTLIHSSDDLQFLINVLRITADTIEHTDKN